MKKRILSMILVLVLCLGMVPVETYGYIGAIGKAAQKTVGGELYGDAYYLKNEYISFAIEPSRTGIEEYTSRTGSLTKDRDMLNHKTGVATFGVSDNYSNPSPLKAKATKLQTYKVEVETDGDGNNYLKVYIVFADNRFDAIMTYKLVKLNAGTNDGLLTDRVISYKNDETTENWGVLCDVKFSYIGRDYENSYDRIVPYLINSYYINKIGHPTSANNADVNLGVVQECWTDLRFEKYEVSANDITDGLGFTSTFAMVSTRARDWKYVYYTEAYTDSYPFANPFVALSGFYNYLTDESYGDPSGVAGHGERCGYPEYVHYDNRILTTYSGDQSIAAEEDHTSHVASLHGLRDLYTKAEEEKFSNPDEVDINKDAGLLAIFKQGDRYEARAASTDSELETLKKSYGTPVAVFRGEHTEQDDGSFVFTKGAAALTPTITATWDTKNGSFKVNADGTIVHNGISLNAPSFKFYRGDKSGLGLGYDSKGMVITMNPKTNKAIISVDIPYASTLVEKVTADLSGNLIFSGDIGFRTVFEGAYLDMQQLGYGLKNGQFKVNGVQAEGELSTAKLLGLKLAEVKGAINTFPGQERYKFSLDLNVYDLFSAAAELDLKRLKSNGELMPNSLYFKISATPGVILVPPVPVAQLNGGGAGFYNLADTINGDYEAIPPIKLRGTVVGTFAHVAQGQVDAIIGPSELSVYGSDIHLVGTKLNVLDYYGFSLQAGVQERKKGGETYTGLAFKGTKSIEISLPTKEINLLGVDASVGAEIYGGINKNKSKLYAQLQATGNINVALQIPKSSPILAGKKLGSVGASILIGGNTVIPIRGVSLEEGIKRSFENIDVYIGVCSTYECFLGGVRAWVVAPDCVINAKKGTNWNFQAKLFKSFGKWSWSEAGIQTASYNSAPYYLNNTLIGTDTVPLMKATSAQVTVGALNEGENAVILLAFDKNVTEEQIKNALNVSADGTAVNLEWLNAEGSNMETANATTELLTNEDGNEYRVAILGFGENGGNKTYSINAGVLNFTTENETITPMDGLNATIAAGHVNGNVKYPDGSKKYVLQTYLGSKQGEGEHLVDERTLDGANTFAFSVETEGTLAATGDYYVSTVLAEEVIGDFNEDGVEETALVAIDTVCSEDTIAYKNLNEPGAPANVMLQANGNETMLGSWTAAEDADGYRITLYNADGSETGLGYEYDAEEFLNTTGLHYDEATKTYSIDMAPTAGAQGAEVAEDGTSASGTGDVSGLAPNMEYKIGVTAFKYFETEEGETTTYPTFGKEIQSSNVYLPEYKELEINVFYDGIYLEEDADSGIYYLYSKEEETYIRVTAKDEPNAQFTITRTDTGEAVEYLDGENYFKIPVIDGAVMLEVTGTIDHQGTTDVTKEYIMFNADSYKPMLTLDEHTFFADKDTGVFTVSGQAEPGATIYNGDEEIAVAAADGRFSFGGTLYYEDPDDPAYNYMETGRTYLLTAVDAAYNQSDNVLAIVGVEAEIDNSALEAVEVGDVNEDGMINAEDALLILKYAVQIDLTGETFNKEAAHTNGDGLINADDALNVLKYAVNIIEKLPVE